MQLKYWFYSLVLFLVVKEAMLYGLYALGIFAIPWSIIANAVWFVVCGLFFWFHFDSQAQTGKFLVAKECFVALATIISAQLLANFLSIGGQLLLIKNISPRADEWDGVLAGYSGLYVYGGYAANRVINIWLQFTTNYHAALQEWSIIIIVEIMAVLFVFRKMRRKTTHSRR